MKNTEQVIIIGHMDIGSHLHQLVKEYHNVEIISPQQAKEKGITPPNMPVFEIKPIPLLNDDFMFTPPLTRAQRRKNQRKNK